MKNFYPIGRPSPRSFMNFLEVYFNVDDDIIEDNEYYNIICNYYNRYNKTPPKFFGWSKDLNKICKRQRASGFSVTVKNIHGILSQMILHNKRRSLILKIKGW